MNRAMIVKLLVSVLALVCFFLQMQPIFQQFADGETTTGVHYSYRYPNKYSLQGWERNRSELSLAPSKR
jgi:hypothetical protein